MEIARAIYKGGEIVKADDDSLNYYSYINLGLRCPICGEEVHLKKGDVKKPHFAHFHKTDDSDECALRLEANGSSSGWQNIVEGKGQRREIFQQHFLDIIASSYSDFETTIETVYKNSNQIKIAKTIQKCSEYFIENKKKFIDGCENQLIFLGNNEIIKFQIVIEALEYLFQKSSISVLEKCIYYILNYKNKDKVEVERICTSIIEIIINANWNSQFSRTFKKRIVISKDKVFPASAKIYQELINSQKLNTKYNCNNKTNVSKENICLFFSFKRPITLIFAVRGYYISVTENISIKLASKDFKYEYCVGDVYLLDRLDLNNQKLIGKLTKENFHCIYDTDNYNKISKQIQNKYAREVIRVKKINQAIEKMAKRIHWISPNPDSIKNIKDNIYKEAKFSISKSHKIQDLNSAKYHFSRDVNYDDDFMQRLMLWSYCSK